MLLKIIYIFLLVIIIFFANNNFILAYDFETESGLYESGIGTGHIDSADPELRKPLAEQIGRIIRIFLTFLGIIFLGFMIYGGYIWMLARGNEQEITRAKDIIKNAIRPDLVFKVINNPLFIISRI